MKRKNLRRGLSIVIAYFTLILILALFLFALIPTLIDTAKLFPFLLIAYIAVNAVKNR